jgi:hypothetical protein
VIELPLPPAEAEALERGAALLQAAIDATPWRAAWIPKPRILLRAPTLLIGLDLRADASRGVDPCGRDLIGWWEVQGDPPTTPAEAAQSLRRNLVELFDHQLREHIRAPGGAFAFEPHRYRQTHPAFRGNAPVTGDYRSNIDAR